MGFLSARAGLLSFDELVANVADEVLRYIFGECLVFSVWTYLEVNFVGRLDVARKPKAFSGSLKDLFRSITAQTLERLNFKALVPSVGGKVRI